MENKKPIYKNKWIIAVGVLILIGLAFGGKSEGEKAKKVDSAKKTIETDSIQTPKKIELSEVKLLSDGFKVSCAFYKDMKYVKVKGKLKVEIYNWNMSDNVDYTDHETYDLGIKLVEEEFDVDPTQLIKETISYKFENKIKSNKKPNKTYLTARFTFTPDDEKSIHIISGSSYQAL
jgi:hypothetical protein